MAASEAGQRQSGFGFHCWPVYRYTYSMSNKVKKRDAAKRAPQG